MYFRTPAYASITFLTSTWDGDPNSLECLRHWRERPDFREFVQMEDGSVLWLLIALIGTDELIGRDWAIVGVMHEQSPHVKVHSLLK